MNRENLCDEDCNHCPLIIYSNSRMLTRVFNLLYQEFGDEAYDIIQKHCPNLTVCYDCRVDDFDHYNDCKIMFEE